MVAMNDQIYILDENQTLVSVLSCQLPNACPYWDDLKTEQLEHGLLTFEFLIPSDHPTAELMVNEGFVIRQNEEADGDYELFRIKELKMSKSSKSLYVFAENAAVTNLTGQIIRPTTLPSKTIAQVMEEVLQNTGWELGRVDYAGVQDFTFDKYMTALEAVHKIMDQFDAEIRFRVEFNGAIVVGKYIDMLLQRGSDTGKLFSYGYDLTDQVERVSNSNDIVTALIGVGPDDSSGNPMTFSNYNPVVPDGYEKQGDWIGNTEARERWGDEGKHIFGVYQNTDVENQVDLYNQTKAELDELTKPKYTYTVGVVLLEDLTGYEAHRVSLGDNIQVQDKTFNPPLYLAARVIEKKTSIQDPTQNTVTLGEFIPLISTTPSIVQQAQTTINRTTGVAGGHVVVNSPTQDDAKGYYAQSDESITIAVTNTVHLGYASIFTAEEITAGVVELRDSNDNIIESRTFDATNLIPEPDSVYEYVLKLNFLLSPSVGTYKLWGSFNGQTFVRFSDEVSFPYDSGEFKITGTSDIDGYYWHFFKLQVAGSGVLGGYGQTLSIGDLSNNLGTFAALNTAGETTFVIDNDQVSIGVANIGQVVSDSIVNYSNDDLTFYVNALTGDDENDGLTSGTALASVTRALQLVPRMCDGNITIYIQSDINEDINILGFIGLNAINIYGGSRTGASAPFTYTHYTIIGDMAFDSTTKRVNFTYGRYFPRTQKTGSSGATNFGAKSQYVYFRECYISARIPGTSNYSTNAVAWNDNGYIHLSHCFLQDWGTNAIRAASHGRIHLEACSGSTANTSARIGEATIGGMITFQGGTNLLTNLTTVGYPQAGSGTTSNYFITSYGGMVNGSTTPPATNGTGGTGTTPPSTTPTTVVYGSNNSGRSYRYTVYVGWRSDLDVREGEYGGYGQHKGLWFFSGVGATPPWIGKTIKEIWVYVIRLNEGGGAGTVRFKTHNYLSQPAGNPTIGSAYVSASFKFGEKKWVRLDQNATIKAAFAANTAKGIAIDGGDYAIFSIAANLKVIYQ
jgi:phage minor structural protein